MHIFRWCMAWTVYVWPSSEYYMHRTECTECVWFTLRRLCASKCVSRKMTHSSVTCTNTAMARTMNACSMLLSLICLHDVIHAQAVPPIDYNSNLGLKSHQEQDSSVVLARCYGFAWRWLEEREIQKFGRVETWQFQQFHKAYMFRRTSLINMHGWRNDVFLSWE